MEEQLAVKGNEVLPHTVHYIPERNGMIECLQNFRSCKLAHSDRKQISGCLRAGTGSGDSKGRRGDFEGASTTFWGVLGIFSADCLMVSQGQMSPDLPNDTLEI